MKINFLLPRPDLGPSGGYKIVYEYANMFANNGDEVIINYACESFSYNALWKKLIKMLRGIFRLVTMNITKSFYGNEWFALDPRIKKRLVFDLSFYNIKDADVTVATAWYTAVKLNTYPKTKGKKVYLIQSFEDWSGKRGHIIETWKMPFLRIVISKSLKKMADEIGVESHLVENGLNFNDFYKIPIQKKKNQIMMLFHSNEKVKQSQKAVSKIIELKRKVPELELKLFGTPQKPKNLPNWIEYFQTPSIEKLRNLYNESSIFIGSSLVEGWGLTVSEAMQCGTFVCVTDINGYDFVKHDETGYKIDSSLETLGETLDFLLKNEEIVRCISQNGYDFIQNFTWEKAFEKIKKLFKEVR